MSKFRIINLFDKIFITITIFLITYAWINFFIRNLYLTFVLSLIFTFSITFILFYLTNKKAQKQNISKTYLKDVDEKFLAFRLLSSSEQINLINTILAKDETIKINSRNLTFSKNNKQHQIVIATEQEKLSQHTLINLISNRNKNTEILQIICEDFEPNLNTNLLDNLTVEIITKKMLYDKFFLTHNIFPNTSNLSKQTKRIGVKNFFKNFFKANKSKGYFLCGLVLIFSSIILPFHIYYLIFGTTLLIFSLLCKIIPLLKN